MLNKYLFALCVFLFFQYESIAQFSDIRGKVTDGTEPVSIAYVKLSKDDAVVKNANVSAEGDFIFSELPIGEYLVTVYAMGYKEYLVNVQLSSDDSKYLSICLESKNSLIDTFSTATIRARREIEDDPPAGGDEIVGGPYDGIGGGGK